VYICNEQFREEKFVMRYLSVIFIALYSMCTFASAETNHSFQQNIGNQDPLTEENVWERLEQKAVWFKEGLEAQADLAELPEDFLKFYTKFRTDADYQKEHTDFESLIGVIGECESTIILNASNWEFQTDNIEADFSEPSEEEVEEQMIRYFFSSDSKILFEYEIEEIGIIYRLGFEKINGTWKETLYQLDVC